MGKRKTKRSSGVYKKELRNEPVKFEVNQSERELLNLQVRQQQMKQSDYLRYLLLEKAPTRIELPARSYSLTNTIRNLGRQLNQTAKKLNLNLLADETLAIETEEANLISQIDDLLVLVEEQIDSIAQVYQQERDIQIKFLLSKSELELGKDILRQQEMTFSRYMRQQITGYCEREHKSKIKELQAQLGKVNNNVGQIQVAIAEDRQSQRLVIIDPQTEYQVQNIQHKLENIGNCLLGPKQL